MPKWMFRLLRRKRFYLLLMLLALSALGWYAVGVERFTPAHLAGWIERYPTLAPLLFTAAYIVSNMAILPLGLPFNLMAGLIWGAWAGTLLISVGAAFSAAFAFLAARAVGYRQLRRWLTRWRKEWMLQSIAENDWKLVMLSRLNPAMPFGASNYLFGLTGISFRRYMAVTIIGNFIPSYFFSAVGESLSTLFLPREMQATILNLGIALGAFTLFYTARIFMRKPTDTHSQP